MNCSCGREATVVVWNESLCKDCFNKLEAHMEQTNPFVVYLRDLEPAEVVALKSGRDARGLLFIYREFSEDVWDVISRAAGANRQNTLQFIADRIDVDNGIWMNRELARLAVTLQEELQCA